jgi:hypothetical protein
VIYYYSHSGNLSYKVVKEFALGYRLMKGEERVHSALPNLKNPRQGPVDRTTTTTTTKPHAISYLCLNTAGL